MTVMHSKRRTSLALLLSAVWFMFIIQSCSRPVPLTIALPTPHIQPPQISADSSFFGAGLNLLQQNEVILVQNLSDESPILDTLILSRAGYFSYPSVYLSIPLLDRFRLNVDNERGIKLGYQLTGVTPSPDREHSWSTALSVAYKTSQSGPTEKNLYDFGSDIDSVSYDWEWSSLTFDWVMGTSLFNRMSLYGGPFYSLYDFTGSLQQFTRYSPLFPREMHEYDLSNGVEQTGLAIALGWVQPADIGQQTLSYHFAMYRLKWGDHLSDIQMIHGFTMSYSY